MDCVNGNPRGFLEYLLNSVMLPIFGREEGSKCFI